MSQINYEDLIMKRSLDLFSHECLEYLNIHRKIKSTVQTELVTLDIKNMHMDYNFLSEDNVILHFEFQTTNKGIDDLRRFRAYEALLSYKEKKNVETYVIYSGDIKNPKDELKTGFGTFKVKAISLANNNSDDIFNEIQTKLSINEELTKSLAIQLILTPIMGGTLSKKDKILKAVQLSSEFNDELKIDIQAMCYAFANKFLDKTDLEQKKEALSMTELGKLIKEEGIKEGIKEGLEKGIEEGKLKANIETAKKMLLEGLSDDVIIRITGLDIETLNKMKKNM